MRDVDHGPLGKTVAWEGRYNPALLHAMPRAPGRAALGLGEGIPFRGCDIWNAYEVSWLEPSGRPRVAVMEMRVPADSPAIVESKSLKLYLGSLNDAVFASQAEVESRIAADLAACLGVTVSVVLESVTVASGRFALVEPEGECIDDEPCAPAGDSVDPTRLFCPEGAPLVTETLVSHLLRSNCPVTSQPDWATVIVRYYGPRIDRQGLLGYVVSFRHHNDFHEQCVERMFMDIREGCGTRRLSVLARYTRRGGIDINPFRSDFEPAPANTRLLRQ